MLHIRYDVMIHDSDKLQNEVVTLHSANSNLPMTGKIITGIIELLAYADKSLEEGKQLLYL
jgi:hypothetical protein